MRSHPSVPSTRPCLLFEIFHPSVLKYDPIKGHTLDDSGNGLPAAQGWVRTGYFNNPTDTVGIANCTSWSSYESDEYGTIVEWDFHWNADPYFRIDPRRAFTDTCDSIHRVWCIEN